jgi:hypothetical protein
MTRLTKRHAFNFLRSYFDVLNEIPKNEDKLEFLLSIINKQFLDEDPSKLNFIVKLSYESQRHAIEKSVKGYKDKMKTDLLGNPLTASDLDPKQGGAVGCTVDPKQQEEEEEKGQEEEKPIVPTFTQRKEKFILWFNESKRIYTGKLGKAQVLSTTDENNLKKLLKSYTVEDFNIAVSNLYKSKWADENNMLTISHFVRIENFNKYLEQGDRIGEPKKAVNNNPVIHSIFTDH